MAFSDQLLADGESLWAAQTEHPFVVELAEGTLDEEAFLTWVRQDYQYLLDYARVFSIAGAKARDEETMTHLPTFRPERESTLNPTALAMGSSTGSVRSAVTGPKNQTVIASPIRRSVGSFR